MEGISHLLLIDHIRTPFEASPISTSKQGINSDKNLQTNIIYLRSPIITGHPFRLITCSSPSMILSTDVAET